MKKLITVMSALSSIAAFGYQYQGEPVLMEVANKKLILDERISEEGGGCPEVLTVKMRDLEEGSYEGMYDELGKVAIFIDGVASLKSGGGGISAIIPISGINGKVQKFSLKGSDYKSIYERQTESQRDSFSHKFQRFEVNTFNAYLNGAEAGPFTKILRHDVELDVFRDGKGVIIEHSEYEDRRYEENSLNLSCRYTVE